MPFEGNVMSYIDGNRSRYATKNGYRSRNYGRSARFDRKHSSWFRQLTSNYLKT